MQLITPSTPNWQKIVSESLQSGGIVLHPTDTSYGLAVDATNEEAITKVFEVKQRENKPLIIIVKDMAQAEEYVEFTPLAKELAEKYWPGALSIILNKKPNVPDALTCGQESVAIRIPDSDITKTISESFNKPYTSTSANLSGQPTAYSVEDALKQLDEDLIDVAIDVGTLPDVPTSTVVDARGDEPVVMRQGGVVLQPSF